MFNFSLIVSHTINEFQHVWQSRLAHFTNTLPGIMNNYYLLQLQGMYLTLTSQRTELAITNST